MSDLDENGKERRRFVRVDSRIVAWYRSESSGELAYVETFGALTKNIGAGGILFETDENLPVGTVLEIEMTLPALSEVIKTKARVAHIEMVGEGRYDLGLMFVDVSSPEQKRIEEFVRGLS